MRTKEKKYIYLAVCTFFITMLFFTACSKEKTQSVRNGDYATAIENAQIGDIFVIGEFEQDGDRDNGNEAISWRVLDKNDKGILLISEQILEYGAYHYEGGETTWNDCYSRVSWKDFRFEYLFTEEDIKHISWESLENGDNEQYESDGGLNTKDRIFFLGLEEVKKYFSNDADRCATATEFARSEVGISSEETKSSWWVRTPGADLSHAVYVSESGKIEMAGEDVAEDEKIGQRPAIWLMKEEQVDIYGSEELSYSKIEDAQEGEFVLFGHYEQNSEKKGEEPIEWIVLAREDDKILLLSRFILKKVDFGWNPYWESSEVREWLNEDFYKSAFSIEEKASIQAMLTSEKTSDLVFCLSAEETRGLFETKELRIAYITKYLRANKFKNAQGKAEWWTRSVSTAKNGKGVVPVETDGNVRSAGTTESASGTYIDTGVRPALCINLSGVSAEQLNMLVFGYDSNHDLDNESMPSGGNAGSGSSSTGKCPACGGSGVIKYYYGSSDLEAYLSGHDPYELGECPMCDGTGI